MSKWLSLTRTLIAVFIFTPSLSFASDVAFANPCEQSVSRADSFLGFLSQGWTTGQVSVDELIAFRDFLESKTSDGTWIQDDLGTELERRLRARVFEKLVQTLSQEDLKRTSLNLNELIDRINKSVDEREIIEVDTTRSYEKMAFVPVSPGRTVATYYGRFGDGHLDKYMFKVRVTRRFWAAEMLVSREHWKIVMGSMPRGDDRSRGPDAPVGGVQGVEAIEFIDRLNEFRRNADPRLRQVTLDFRPGAQFVLMTNAEWSVFADQYGEEWPEYFPLGFEEFVEDEVIMRKHIPYVTMVNPRFLNQDSESRQLHVGYELGPLGNRQRALHVLWRDGATNPDVGVRVAMVIDETRVFEKIWNWLISR